MTDTPRHNYDQLIANWMARPDADQDSRPEDRMGFMRSGMEETLREAGLNAGELASEMVHFDAAAMRFLNGAPGAAPAEPAPSAPYDFDQSFRDWTQNPENRLGKLARPSARMGAARTVVTASRGKLEAEFRREGLSEAAMAKEMARYDEAAKRFLDEEGKRWIEETNDANPLGFWGWVGALLISGSVAVGAFGLIIALLLPLQNVGKINQISTIVAAAVAGGFVFAAALLVVRKLIRDYREIGFIMFWLPMILGGQALSIAPATLTKMLTDDMGPDFLALALPLAGLAGGGLVLASLFGIWWYWPGRKPTLPDESEIHPLMTLLLAGFSVLFFTIGAREILGWGSGPSLVVGFFVTGVIIRIFHDGEISWIFVPIVAVPLALLAVEMPPSNLAALTVLALALAAGFVTMLVTLARRERRTVLFTSLTAAALALILVMAPTGPSPALWLADKLGHPLRPLGDAAMGFYARLYETDQGHAILAALDGYRGNAAGAQIQHYDLGGRTMALTIDLRNMGERGIGEIRVNPVDQEDRLESFAGCGRPTMVHAFANTLWPGDVERVTLKWVAPDECLARTLKDLSDHVYAGLGTYGWRKDLEIEVLETRAVDPVQRFREDAREWLGL